MKDYYKVLGVPRNATNAQIKSAFRNLVKIYHPDINKTGAASERTKELNEAWTILSDPEAKISYDSQTKVADASRPSASARSNATKPAPKTEQNYCCEKCGIVNSTLRVSIFWRVYSLIYYTWKKPFAKILCNKCRVKASLVANAVSMSLGWWSVWGLLWTPIALFKNSMGGDQPKDSNATLLNSLGFRFYHSKRFQEAREAFSAGSKFQNESNFDEIREYFKHQPRSPENRSLWTRFCGFYLHPVYYHVPVALAIAALLLIGFIISNADQSSSAPLALHPHTQHPSKIPELPPGFILVTNITEFSEPEQSLPPQGVLNYSADYANYEGTKAPFKISTRPSDGNYVMKIEDWETGNLVATYFIRRGSVLSLELPLGSYKLKFAMGDKWYGPKFLFGPSTIYSYIAGKMDFYISGDYANGHQIELIPQVGGNLETPALKPSDW